MEFCAITPIRYLEQFTAHMSHHMVLAQYCHLADYLSFYKRMVAEGRTVILDNGTYEEERMPFKQLLEVVRELNPTVVVLPDEPNDHDKTWELSVKFADKLREDQYPGQTMMVLHAEPGDLHQFMKMYLKASLYANWVGFSRLTPSYGLPNENPATRRVQLAKRLKVMGYWRFSARHHALGMLNGNVNELHWLATEGFRSIDSSAPVWRGLNDCLLGEEWEDVKFDPSSTAGTGRMDLDMAARQNLNQVVDACRGVITAEQDVNFGGKG